MADAILRINPWLRKAANKNPISRSEHRQTTREEGSSQWYNPCSWYVEVQICMLIICFFFLGIFVSVILWCTRKDEYPDYTPIPYSLIDTYAGPSFFDKFNYFSDVDPTHGFVKYADKATADNLNLTTTTPTSTILKVDTSTRNARRGRSSVRIESKVTYNDGLFLFDIIHTPFGCGTWPALWLTDGYNWPDNGEIDVLEATNNASDGNVVSLHTTKGCIINGTRKHTGLPVNARCNGGNTGCGVRGLPSTYGKEMNDNGGGVYALELRAEGIRVWFFPRPSIPPDILTGTQPDPSAWELPLADFPNTHCDIGSHFRNQSIIVNIDLCGEYGGDKEVYRDQNGCPGNCREFVARHPEAFGEAYWEFAGFRVYQGGKRV